LVLLYSIFIGNLSLLGAILIGKLFWKAAQQWFFTLENPLRTVVKTVIQEGSETIATNLDPKEKESLVKLGAVIITAAVVNEEAKKDGAEHKASAIVIYDRTRDQARYDQSLLDNQRAQVLKAAQDTLGVKNLNPDVKDAALKTLQASLSDSARARENVSVAEVKVLQSEAKHNVWAKIVWQDATISNTSVCFSRHRHNPAPVLEDKKDIPEVGPKPNDESPLDVPEL
jgi:hypothetical protein